MDKTEFEKLSSRLYEWAHGKSRRTFFINGYTGHKITTNGGKLRLIEAEAGNAEYAGDVIELTADDVERMAFIPEDYTFSIVTKDESPHDGQGYDIEVYELTRVPINEKGN